MRKIKFRGKDKAGEWHYGDLLHHDHDVLIIVDEQGKQHKIINETLGQFTGLQDDSKTDIYEGDIICSSHVDYHWGNDGAAGVIVYTENEVRNWKVHNLFNGCRYWMYEYIKIAPNIDNRTVYCTIGTKCYVIDNIHDNPKAKETFDLQNALEKRR